MIRPVLAVLIAASIILFVWQYAAFTDRIRPEPVKIVEQDATGSFDFRLKCTFDCAGNAFGFAAVKVMFRGQVLVERTDKVSAGETILVEGVAGVKEGLNDFHVQLTPSATTSADPGNAFGSAAPATRPEGGKTGTGIANAVRVEILQDGQVIGDEMIWSDSNEPFGELIKIEIREVKGEH